MSDRASSDGPFTRWPGLLRLSLGVLLGPVVTLMNQQAIYAADTWACGHDAHATLHIIPFLALVVVVGTAWQSLRIWRWTDAQPGPRDEGVVFSRTRFLAVLGIAISVFCAVVIIAQWAGIGTFGACARA
jgi:hypothetical protein